MTAKEKNKSVNGSQTEQEEEEPGIAALQEEQEQEQPQKLNEGVLHEILMQHKENKFFAKWKKVYVAITAERMTLRQKREVYEPFASYAVKDLSFQEISGAGKECCVKVFPQHQKKYFMLAAYSFMHMNAFVRTLTKVGAQKKEAAESTGGFKSRLWSDSTAASTTRSRLEVVDVNNWSIQDVQEWLGYLRANDGTKMADQYGQLFAENDIDGRTLLTMGDDELKGIGIKSLGRRMKLLSEIEKLRTKNKYSLNEHLVMSKFERMDPRYMKDLSNLEQRVQALCDVDEIKRTYLNPDQIEMPELKRLMDEEKEEDKESFSIVEEEEVRLHEENKLRVKLIVTEITHSDSQKSLRKILSPIAANIPMVTKTRFGLFHTALIVGPWYLEWNDSSLCIPKKICSSMAIISADVDNIIMPKSSDKRELVEKLAEVIVDWNVNRNYINYKPTTPKPNEGNCQNFVEAVLDKLELKPVFAGALGNYFKDMKNHGTCDMAFRPDQDFLDTFSLLEKKYTFSTHRQLDQFVMDLKKINSTFQLDYPSECGLLKSFDRAFWLRHIRKPEEEDFQCITEMKVIELDDGTKEKREICQCPFEDPRVTKSFR